MRWLGRWIAETRLGRTAFRFGAASLVAVVTFGTVLLIRQHDLAEITQRIEVVERVDPVDLLRECLRTPECRRLFLHPERVRVETGEMQVGARQPDAGSGISQPSTGAEPDVGPDGVIQPPKSGSGGKPAPQKPGSDAPKALPADSAEPAPSSTSPASSSPPPAAPSPSPQAPEPEPPGLLTPALTPVLERVCSVADRLVHLC